MQADSAPAEIDLLALAAALWDRRRLFALIAGGTAGLVLAAGLLLTPVYESEVVVHIGLAGPDMPIEPPGDILGRLRAEHALWREDRPYPRIERIGYLDQRNSPRALRIVAQGTDAPSAQRTAADAATALVAAHSQISTSRLKELERLYKEIDEVFGRQAAQRRARQELQAGTRAELPLWATLAAEAGAQEALPALAARLAALRFEIDTVRRNPTRITFAADLPPDPVRPSWPMLGLIGAFLGLMTATLVVLGRSARSAWLHRHGGLPQ